MLLEDCYVQESEEIVCLKFVGSNSNCVHWTADLPFTTQENSLQQEFSNFGEIAEVKLIKDKSTRRSKGYAFIQFTNQDDALLALENMDHKEFDGRLIFVEIAKPGRDTFGGVPITSGPPKKQHLLTSEPPKKQHFPEQDEVADCWY
ncbi:hypothetical protein JRO89_XS06G0242200 [Xanthoceras sorbifolium]|uniref:RRM domain-containing protein n=1 Tax=Xanthoceras sorbifolium TaxID=99658 RepID=A0ABQ8HZP6_9ROSI|nr:hypothetical protein JRO89_XS06G0242200 [Xanthoceras sorbifolium]